MFPYPLSKDAGGVQMDGPVIQEINKEWRGGIAEIGRRMPENHATLKPTKNDEKRYLPQTSIKSVPVSSIVRQTPIVG